MNKEEAIKILEEEAEFLYGGDEPYNKIAFDMAIEALKAEPKCVAQIKVDTEEIVRRIKEEYDITDGWIPFTRRPMTEEEQKDYPNCTFIVDCVLPDDGDEILVSNGRFVWMDTFCTDIDGCYLDGGDDIDEDMAWMPLPKPYKESEVEE